MLRRFLLGTLEGALIGAALGALLVYGLHIALLAGVLGYLAAVVTGLCVAAIAGKPIWARGAWVEVLLKAIAAAALGAAGMFLMRHYLDVSLSAGPLGTGLPAELPLVALPFLATVLAIFFELDNTGDDEEIAPAKASVREPELKRFPEQDASPLEEEDAEPAAQRRLGRH